MPNAVIVYVRWVEAVGRVFGRLAMYLIFAMAASLLYAAVMRNGWNRPPLWTVEVGQFLLAAYYMLGGAWTMQDDTHVRMDLLYARWRPQKRAFADTITSFCLIAYLLVMLSGGLSSTAYALEYGQRAATSWRPYMAPIKIAMTFGIFLMTLQAFACLARDVAVWRGRPIP